MEKPKHILAKKPKHFGHNTLHVTLRACLKSNFASKSGTCACVELDFASKSGTCACVESENATIDIYAELLLPTIIAIIKKRCHGCNVDHSSQLQHDICLMQPFAVSVHNYIDEALARITVFEINRIATNRASLMKAVDVPLQESVWREKWLPLTEARVLLLHYCR